MEISNKPYATRKELNYMKKNKKINKTR